MVLVRLKPVNNEEPIPLPSSPYEFVDAVHSLVTLTFAYALRFRLSAEIVNPDS